MPGIAPVDEAHARQVACMMIPRWGLDPGFALKVARVVQRFEHATGYRLKIISGFRSSAKQEELILAGTGAPQDRSNHTRCPAHAVDVWPDGLASAQIRVELGRAIQLEGLRWGGCSPGVPGCINPDTGIPQDWNHIDDGPRPT